MNGIIIDGNVYEAEIGLDLCQCNHCDLSKTCDNYFGDPEDTFPCKLFSPCNKIYFKFSQSLTHKLNNSNQ